MNAGANRTFDTIVIGGGIVGLSTAWQLKQRQPHRSILLIEKENTFALHQSGRNSGVIHAGVYYAPGSLKAEFCRQGSRQTYEFCRQHGVRHEQCGKLLVATNEDELGRMEALFKRCSQNGLQPRALSANELARIEPNVSGRAAFLVEESGIVDYPGMCRQMGRLFCAIGGQLALDTEVRDIEELPSGIALTTNRGKYHADFLIACTGLMADRIAHMQGIGTEFRVIPFRGEYFRLRSGLNDIVRHLIYPIPDPSLPFLGVHLTRMIDGSVTIGPNALLGWKREGYGRLNFSVADTAAILTYPGFWKLSRRHFASAIREIRNASWRPAFLRQIQRYCPSVRAGDLRRWPTGVRALTVSADGQMIDDFMFARTDRSLHVCNAPSPAATSALPIGRYICDQLC